MILCVFEGFVVDVSVGFFALDGFWTFFDVFFFMFRFRYANRTGRFYGCFLVLWLRRDEFSWFFIFVDTFC